MRVRQGLRLAPAGCGAWWRAGQGARACESCKAARAGAGCSSCLGRPRLTCCACRCPAAPRSGRPFRRRTSSGQRRPRRSKNTSCRSTTTLAMMMMMRRRRQQLRQPRCVHREGGEQGGRRCRLQGPEPVLCCCRHALMPAAVPASPPASLQPSTSGGANGDALAAAAADGGGGGAAGRGRYSRLGKDPSVRTDFLPDKDRQRAEEELREKLKVGGAGACGGEGEGEGSASGVRVWCRAMRMQCCLPPWPRPTLPTPAHPCRTAGRVRAAHRSHQGRAPGNHLLVLQRWVGGLKGCAES